MNTFIDQQKPNGRQIITDLINGLPASSPNIAQPPQLVDQENAGAGWEEGKNSQEFRKLISDLLVLVNRYVQIHFYK